MNADRCVALSQTADPPVIRRNLIALDDLRRVHRLGKLAIRRTYRPQIGTVVESGIHCQPIGPIDQATVQLIDPLPTTMPSTCLSGL